MMGPSRQNIFHSDRSACSVAWVFSVVLLLSSSTMADAGWGVPGFSYRRKITLKKLPSGAPACHVRFAHAGSIQQDGRDIRITTEHGRVLSHEVLRLGPGDQVEVLFDSRKLQQDAICYVYFGNARTLPPKPWTAQAGVVMEVRNKGHGSADSWEQYQKLYANSKVVLGRTLRPGIFDGFNPLGPNENFVSRYQAWFRAPQAGVYTFATNSDDASFLLVNGSLVAEYPGWHDAWPGRWGQHKGTIQLTAGVHRLEYYHCQGTGEMATIAGWQRPGDPHVSRMPENAFVPVGEAVAAGLERADQKPTLDFQWSAKDHLEVNGRYLICYAFACQSDDPGDVHVDFGDGQKTTLSTQRAPWVVEHIYTRAGTYTVTMKGAAGAIEQRVAVEPVWPQQEAFPSERWPAFRLALAARLDDRSIDAQALLVLLTYAAELEDMDLLRRTSLLAWNLADRLAADEHGELFLTLGRYLQHHFRDFEGSDRAFREVIEGSGDKRQKARATLHRAGLLIHAFGKNQEGLELLKSLDESLLLPPSEPVLRRIYQADALAGLGRREDAIKAYESLRTVVPLTNRDFAANRRGRLLTIRSHLFRGDFEDALEELQNIEWETPGERMLDETGLLRVQCYMGLKDYQRARVLLERLLKVNPASARVPEKLLRLLEACRELNLDEKLDEAYGKLKKEYPYAEETALASRLLKK